MSMNEILINSGTANDALSNAFAQQASPARRAGGLGGFGRGRLPDLFNPTQAANQFDNAIMSRLTSEFGTQMGRPLNVAGNMPMPMDTRAMSEFGRQMGRPMFPNLANPLGGGQLALGQGAGGGGLARMPVAGALGQVSGGGALAVTDDILAQATRIPGLGGVPGAPVVPGAPGAPGALAATTGGRLAALGRFGPAAAGLSRGALMRGGIAGTIGYVGGSMVDGFNLGGEGSQLDQIGSNALKGAGLGATLGSIIPGVGTAVGAGVGAVAGGLYGSLYGDKTNKTDRMNEVYTNMSSTITDLASTYGLTNDATTNLMLEFDATSRIMLEGGDEDAYEAYIDSLATLVPQRMMELRLAQETENRQTQRLMGLQTAFAPMMQGIIDRSAINSGVAYQQALKASDQLAQTNPQLGALIASNAANSQTNSDALMAAYASQIGQVAGTDYEMLAQQALQQNI